MGMILITHDLAVVARNVDRVAVMYGGEVVEAGEADTVLLNPTHSYTRALLDAIPRTTARYANSRRSPERCRRYTPAPMPASLPRAAPKRARNADATARR